MKQDRLLQQPLPALNKIDKARVATGSGKTACRSQHRHVTPPAKKLFETGGISGPGGKKRKGKKKKSSKVKRK
jgi:hypothetical protein